MQKLSKIQIRKQQKHILLSFLKTVLHSHLLISASPFTRTNFPFILFYFIHIHRHRQQQMKSTEHEQYKRRDDKVGAEKQC